MGYEIPLSHKLRLAPYFGAERRFWKSSVTNWWDLELGIGVRLL